MSPLQITIISLILLVVISPRMLCTEQIANEPDDAGKYCIYSVDVF